jgi:ribonucleoside-diphosphate reductase alpha chain
MDCDTTGIEPDFSLIKNKKLSGGGQLKIINNSVKPALQRLGYSPAKIDEILKKLLNQASLKEAGVSPEHKNVFACAIGENALTPEAHLTMMAAVQPFISGAISKTVNMPESSTVDDIGEIYLKAWHWGLKSVAVYRDNSKFAQPLSNATQDHQLNCTECGHKTVLESGCYRCTNCGMTSACAS